MTAGPPPRRETRSTCPYCGVGCGVVIESEGDRITGVRGDPEHPANFGRLCSKGSTLHLTAAPAIARAVRLLRPAHRTERRAPPRPVSWDAAMSFAAERIGRIVEESGPDAVGFYLSGQLLTEDYYVFNKLVKGLVGTNNVDTNSRLCMSSAVAGYKATLGADAPPACYDDLGEADLVFVAGANPAWAHPILFRRLEDARAADPARRLVVVDPRRTETAAMADLHLQIQPGTDVALFHGMLHVMLWEGLVDEGYIARHTTGFEALKRTVRGHTPAEAARACGIAEADLVQAALWFGRARAALSLYCQGLNQSSSGTDKNAALINLHLATGQIGRPGAGPFSLTGQPNAMGGREVGGLSNLLSAHRDLASAADRAEVARLWGVDAVPAAPGRSAVEMFQAAADGEIRALWIACTNPAQSMPDQATVRRALERCEFVVVQEAYAHTATAAYADLLLPATTWGEKDGTVTNSERRISRVRPAVAPPGDARHDWAIALDLARRLEARWTDRDPARGPKQPRRVAGGSGFGHDGPEAIWNEHRETTRGRDLDITGLGYALLERAGPQQWPLREGAAAGTPRLYADGVFPTSDGRARFADVQPRPLAEPRDPRHPFALNTGRMRDQWHGMSRTGTLGRLFGHDGEPAIELHPQDMARRGWQAGQLLRIRSRRGELVLPVRPSAELGLSQAYVPMHWGEEFLGGAGVHGINTLTNPAFCPQSRQPELKHSAVRIERAELPFPVLAMGWWPQSEALALRERLKPLMAGCAHAVCVPFGREAAISGDPGVEPDVGVLWRSAATEAIDDALLAALAQAFGLDGARVLRYQDRRRGHVRAMRLAAGADGASRLRAFLLAGDVRAEPWIRALLEEQRPADAYGRMLLAPGAEPPVAAAPRGAQVCNCLDVDEPRIVETLRQCAGDPPQRLAQLQARLGCGTQCGSCLPTLKTLVRRHAPEPA